MQFLSCFFFFFCPRVRLRIDVGFWNLNTRCVWSVQGCCQVKLTHPWHNKVHPRGRFVVWPYCGSKYGFFSNLLFKCWITTAQIIWDLKKVTSWMFFESLCLEELPGSKSVLSGHLHWLKCEIKTLFSKAVTFRIWKLAMLQNILIYFHFLSLETSSVYCKYKLLYKWTGVLSTIN